VNKELKLMLLSLPISVVLAVGSFGAAQAQYPERPVRIIVPVAPGGGVDVMARLLAQRLQERLHEAFVVENRPGAGGIIGSKSVAAAAPDGYTLLYTPSSLSLTVVVHKNLPYDLDKDFTPIINVAISPYVLVVHPSLPVHSLKEFIAYAKEHPGKISYSSAGVGTASHLAGELLQSMAGITLVHVPYRGSGPALTALIGNEIQLLFDASMTSIGHIRGGRVRGIALASLARLPAVPDLPTFNESGLPGFEVGVGHGMLVQAATPAARIAALNRAVNTALADPEYRKQMADLGVVLVGGTPEQFRAYLASERSKWGELIQKRGIKVD